jgi:hypothetical protein
MGPFALSFVLGSLVVTDHAAGARSEPAMVAEIVPRHSAHDRTLETAFGRSRRRNSQRYGRDRDRKGRGDDTPFHPAFLNTVVDSLTNGPREASVPDTASPGSNDHESINLCLKVNDLKFRCKQIGCNPIGFALRPDYNILPNEGVPFIR